jgi:hypothetical protein
MKSEIAKIGPPWNGGDIQTWPGVAGNPGESNYLANNVNPFLPDPVNTSDFRGGKKHGKKHSKKPSKKHSKKMKKPKKTKKGMKKTKKMKKTMKKRK